MTGRVDFLGDPDAPAATSVVPAASVAVIEEDRILLIRRSDNGLWALPGGGMELGESIAQTAAREVTEETGVDVALTGLVGVYSNPGHRVLYLSDGEVRQEFSILFTARRVSGEPTPSSESSEVAWVSVVQLPRHTMHPSMQLRVRHALEQRESPVWTDADITPPENSTEG